MEDKKNKNTKDPNDQAFKKRWTATGIYNKIIVILALLLIIGGIVGLIIYFSFRQNYEMTNDAQVEQYITPIAAKVSGFVKEVRFQENQYVRKGDTLIIIDNSEYLSELQSAEAQLSTTESNVTAAESEAAATRSNVAIHGADEKAAEVQVWRTQKDYLRYKSLLAEDAVTQQQFEQMKAAYDAAVANLEAVKHQKIAAEMSGAAASSKVAPQKASIAQRQAQTKLARIYLGYTVVTAPYDGWVGKRTLQVGQLVKEGNTLVYVVSQEKWITANFKETQIEKLRVGTPIVIKVDAFRKQQFFGKIGSFSPASGARFSLLPPDNATGNFVKIEQRIPVRIEFTSKQNISLLRAGMNVEVYANFDGKYKDIHVIDDL